MAVPKRRPISSAGQKVRLAAAATALLFIILIGVWLFLRPSSSHSTSTANTESLAASKQGFSLPKAVDSNVQDINMGGEQQNTATMIVQGKGTYQLEHPTGRDGTHLWSEFGQDKYVQEYFQNNNNNNNNKVFVEVGGFDGELHSNTLVLEKEHHWSGILVEANPYAFSQLQEKDRNCWMVHSCLSNQSEQEMEFLVVGRYTTSTSLIEPGQPPRLRGKTDLVAHERDGEGARVTVPCLSLSYIMSQTLKATTHIDYLSMDVEGAEMFSIESVLVDVKEKALTIDLVSIELEGNENEKDIRKLMTEHGYEQVSKAGIDVFFAQQKK